VRVGTRFVAAAEAGVHPEYVAALITAEAQDTAYTEAFSVGWSNAPHRVLRSSIAAAEAFQEGDAIGETSRLDGTRMPIVRFQTGVPDKTTTGAIGAMSLWAGESVGSVKRVQPAAEILRELVEEADWSRLQEERTAMGASP
jgi:nitronate monooxygenase